MKSAIFGKIVPNDPYHVLLFDVTTLTNMINNFAGDLFDGNIFYYEEKDAHSLVYKVQKMFAKFSKGFSRGLVVELIKRKK